MRTATNPGSSGAGVPSFTRQTLYSGLVIASSGTSGTIPNEPTLQHVGLWEN